MTESEGNSPEPGATEASAVDLSPQYWPAEARAEAECKEAVSMRATADRDFEGSQAAISAIASPIAVEAGLQTLRNGGTAADAATAIAMTQTTTQLGSVVSFAGIMSMLYFDQTTATVYSLDAGFNSYRNETDPETIPVADLGALSASNRAGSAGGGNAPGVVPDATGEDLGRETMVAGYMAGFEAMHRRFGALPWSVVFQPAIWYAEQGITLSPELAGFFKWRANFLRRTPEGRAFLEQAGSDTPEAGTVVRQLALAETLRAVAAQGARYMYVGDWAHNFIRIVQREGGKVVPADLHDYNVHWMEPVSTSFAGTMVYAPGHVSYAGHNAIPLINLAEALGLEDKPAYWRDPKSFVALTGIAQLMEGAPVLSDETRAAFAEHGIDTSREAQLTKEFAAQAAKLVPGVYATGNADDHHSNSLVVADRFGNVAATTHTINSVVWGSTGIVVDGIPIPDSAGFQQFRLKTLSPGDRVPHEMVQTIVLRDGSPVMATAAIGSALVPETLRLIVSVIGQGQSLAETQAAPPLLTNFALGEKLDKAAGPQTAVPEGAYAADFLSAVTASGLNAIEVSPAVAAGLRGTVTAVAIDPATGRRSAGDIAGTLIFAGAS